MTGHRTIVIECIEPYGLYFLNVLLERKDNVYVIDENEDLCKKVAESMDCKVLHGKVIEGILTNELNKFDAFVAAASNEGDNLISCMYAKKHYEVPIIIAVVQTPASEETFTSEGFFTVNPERATAKILLRYLASDPKVIERITATNQSELVAFEIKPDSKLDGKEIATIPLTPKDYNVVCVLRDNRIIFAKPKYVLSAGDILQIAIHPEHHKKLEEYLK